MKNFKQKNAISKDLEIELKSNNDLPSKFYILHKIYKPGNPGRPITSFINSPLYNLSKFLRQSIQKVIGITKTVIKDYWHLIELVNRIDIPDDYILVSIDMK